MVCCDVDSALMASLSCHTIYSCRMLLGWQSQEHNKPQVFSLSFFYDKPHVFRQESQSQLELSA